MTKVGFVVCYIEDILNIFHLKFTRRVEDGFLAYYSEIQGYVPPVINRMIQKAVRPPHCGGLIALGFKVRFTDCCT